MSTVAAKKTTTLNDKVPMILKDVGLLGFCIYVLWADNDKNKENIAALQQKDYQFEIVINNLTDEVERIQELTETQTILLERVADKLEDK